MAFTAVVHLAITRTVIGWRSFTSAAQSVMFSSIPSDTQKEMFKYLSSFNSLLPTGMVGVMVKVMISREHSLTLSTVGETCKYENIHLSLSIVQVEGVGREGNLLTEHDDTMRIRRERLQEVCFEIKVAI